MSNPFKPLFEFMGTEEFKTAFEQFKASKEPKKEWEIVAYLNGGCIYKRQEGDSGPKFSDGNCYFNTDFANEPRNKCLIHSVRRLSDGEVFSVGDRLQNFKNQITRVNIGDRFVGGIGFECGDNGEGTALFAAKKLPNPLFTTVDGKEIHEGNEFWAVYKEDYAISEVQIAHVNSMMLWKGTFLFSTREAALSYIENNKPVLSLNDVTQAYNDLSETGITGLLDKLTTLVKSKRK